METLLTEAIAFAEHLETRYDYAIDQHYLSNLFNDAFGRAGQQPDTYQEHEDRISNNVIADVHGQGKAELIAPLGGLDIETNRCASGTGSRSATSRTVWS